MMNNRKERRSSIHTRRCSTEVPLPKAAHPHLALLEQSNIVPDACIPSPLSLSPPHASCLPQNAGPLRTKPAFIATNCFLLPDSQKRWQSLSVPRRGRDRGRVGGWLLRSGKLRHMFDIFLSLSASSPSPVDVICFDGSKDY